MSRELEHGRAALELELEHLAGALDEMSRVENNPRDGRYSRRWIVCRAHALAHAGRIAALYRARRTFERELELRPALPEADAGDGIPAVHLMIDADGSITVRVEVAGEWLDAITATYERGCIVSEIAEPGGIRARARDAELAAQDSENFGGPV